jgi:hypothetical protein
MRYMIIVKATKDSEAGILPGEEMLAKMAEYHEKLAEAGILADGSGLQASSKGWRIKYFGKETTFVDGPFTEAKELIAGFTIIQVKSREEAIEWTKRFPNPSLDGREGEIEVRLMFELEDFGASKETERFQRIGIGSSK